MVPYRIALMFRLDLCPILFSWEAIKLLKCLFVGKEASMLKSWFKYFDTNMNGIIEKQEFVERHLAQQKIGSW